MRHVNYTWMLFLLFCFAVVGMTGLFATYAAPTPLERAMLREAALDALLAAPNPATAEALRDRLGESAKVVLPLDNGLPERVARERREMRARFLAEAEEGAHRLRALIGIVTLMAAAFGIAILGIAHRPAPPR